MTPSEPTWQMDWQNAVADRGGLAGLEIAFALMPDIRVAWQAFALLAVEALVAAAIIVATVTIVPERQHVPDAAHPGGVSQADQTSRESWMRAVRSPGSRVITSFSRRNRATNFSDRASSGIVYAGSGAAICASAAGTHAQQD